ncbi:MAG: hypothetical protein EWV91_11640 [Microcystis aeruginosa Ma_QC_Ca_00000000_S207]|uniref:Phytanoyl-CoA dioxygenase n=1 Tax=Microcystis aeruginosa Ma_QC_Ca_00000000_S207 TaxID=2486251 RepID=A0A552FK32_MICAE|nr:MAG: hypothetical protein EWV91_11640 [Microcystis aeruginosa Ma_QC_Ca_00000000_S207]
MKISDKQIEFFNTFGYLKLPGLLYSKYELIESAFEQCWSNFSQYPKPFVRFEHGFLFQIAESHPELLSVLISYEIEDVVTSLLGSNFQYVGSKGNRFHGDTPWHRDSLDEFNRLKSIHALIYLDELNEDSGCIRVIPGSHRILEPYSQIAGKIAIQSNNEIRPWVLDINIPHVSIPSKPGDIILINHNIVHGSQGGGDDRRLLSFNFWEEIPDSETEGFLAYLCKHSSFNVETVIGSVMQDLLDQEWGKHCRQVSDHRDITRKAWHKWKV